MDLDSLKQALHRQPFETFRLRLVDGRGIDVPHPDFMAVAPRRVVILAQDSSWTMIDPRLIVSLDQGSPSTTAE